MEGSGAERKKSVKFALVKHILLIVVVAITLFGCSGSGGEKPTVTVSLPPQKFILERIVGDAYDVRSLVVSGGDAENYDPSFTNLMSVRKSAAYMTMGNIGFEQAVVDKIRQENPELPVYDSSRGINFIRGTHGNEYDVDPHTWSSVANVRIMAANMEADMERIDPARAPQFRANLKRFTATLDSLDADYRCRLEPLRGSSFLVWHPSLSYFARDYGLHQIALGGAEHKEVSIPALREAIEEARGSGASVFFVQRDIDSRQAESANERIGARRVEFVPLDYDWMAQMDIVVNALTAKQ